MISFLGGSHTANGGVQYNTIQYFQYRNIHLGTEGIRPSLTVAFCGTVQAPTTSSSIWTLTLLTLLPLYMQEKQAPKDIH